MAVSSEGMRGYYAIGIVGPKTKVNVGTLWRSAACMGAQFIFTAGHRYPKQPGDTMKAWRHIPLFEYGSAGDLFASLPCECVPVAVELDPRATPLAAYTHPERALYLLGAEDEGLSLDVLDACRDIVQLPGERCLNVAVAGSIVLYDRLAKAATTSAAHRPRAPKSRGLPVAVLPAQGEPGGDGGTP